jgi:tetratricopeptide (TPR) repeat protein
MAELPDPATPSPEGLRRARDAVAAAWAFGQTLIFGVLPALLALAAVVAVVREAARAPIEVGSLSVPPALAEKGLTPEVAALRLMDAIEATARAVRAETLQRPAAELEGAQPDVTIPGAGISLRSLSGMVRTLLGWPERRLSGEILADGEQLQLRLRLAGHGVIADVAGPASAGADALLRAAAPELWRVVAPRLYAWYLANAEAPQEAVRDRLIALRRRAPDAETEATLTYLIARSLVRSGRAEEALDMLDPLVVARPDYPAAHYGRAMALQAQGRIEPALEAQGRGLALDPESPWAHLASAALLRELGWLDAALAAARRAQDLDDDDRAGLVEEAYVLRAMARLSEAADPARRAVALDARYGPAHAALGQVALRQHEEMAALAAFEVALAASPQLAEAHAGRAEALAVLGRHEEAAAALATATALGAADSLLSAPRRLLAAPAP